MTCHDRYGASATACYRRSVRTGRRLSGLLLLSVGAGAPSVFAGGCATTWAISEIGWEKPPLDENQRAESVPLPGVREQVKIRLYLAGRPPSTMVAPAAGAAGPPMPAVVQTKRLQATCQVTQTGAAIEYRASTRYGPKWRSATALSFLLEAIGAGLFFFSKNQPGGYVVAGMLGTDAVATGVLHFAPAHDIYESARHEDELTVRRNCPEGLALRIAGRTAAFSAVGQLDDVGQALFEQYMSAPAGGIQVALGRFEGEVPITPNVRCAWAVAENRPRELATCSSAQLATALVPLEVAIAVPTGMATGWRGATARPR